MQYEQLNYDQLIAECMGKELIERMKGYHYTDIKGFMNIVNPKVNSMWVSHIRFMNDREEYIKGHDLIKEMLKNIKELENMTQKERTLVRNLIHEKGNYFNNSEDIIEKIGSINTRRYYSDEIYVLCFCQQPDLLSQWRGYGKTSGVAIEFDLEDCSFGLGKKPETFKKYIKAYEVIYDDNEKQIKFDRLYNRLRDEIINQSKTGGGFDAYARFLLSALFALIPYFKNKSFSEEKEFRLVFRTENNEAVKYREKNGILLPYIKLNCLKKDGTMGWPVKSVTVGPGYNQDDVYQSIKYYLKNKDHKEIELRRSEIPYRG